MLKTARISQLGSYLSLIRYKYSSIQTHKVITLSNLLNLEQETEFYPCFNKNYKELSTNPYFVEKPESVNDEAISLGMTVLEHWVRAHSVPLRGTDRKGPIFSLILTSVVGTNWSVKAPIDINWFSPCKNTEYQIKAEYGLCFGGTTIPIFEAKASDINDMIIKASLYTKCFSLTSNFNYSYAIITNLTEWIFVTFDKMEYQRTNKEAINLYSFNLMNDKIFDYDRHRTKQLLVLIKNFIRHANNNSNN